MPTRVVNKFPAKCAYCHKRVDPYGGLCWLEPGHKLWTTAHEPCIPNLDAKLPKVQGHAAAIPASPSPRPLPAPTAAPKAFPNPFDLTDDDVPF